MKSVDRASISRSMGLFMGGAPGGLIEPVLKFDADCAIAVLTARDTTISAIEARMAARLYIGAFQLETGPACGAQSA